MQEQKYLGHLEPGMDVCDIDGEKLGSVARIFRNEMATAATGGTPAVGTMPREELLEVKTGLFGLGQHLYVPFSAIQDVTSGCVFINQPKDRIQEQNWDTRPDYIEEMS
jgi:hypothetical protein